MTQQEALDILKLGHNVFLTGPAGSGKTYLLNRYIEYLKSQKITVGITASTGIAATHMGGTTIHSWAGMGIHSAMSVNDIRHLFRKSYLKKRFLKTKVLIIDEISMLHAKRLDLVNEICQTFWENSNPFGGMQVIMCGDFFQLPPVTKKDDHSVGQMSLTESSGQGEKTDFVTESRIWKEMKLQICYLEEQYRQNDRAYFRVLNDIRNREVTEMTYEYLSERLDVDIKGYARPTRLFTHNVDVDAINLKHLQELNTDEHEYEMITRGSSILAETLKKSCLAPEKLVLKKGAQVMFIKNNYEVGYVNGTLGEVIGFDTYDCPIVRTFDGSEIVVNKASWEVKEDEKELAAIAQMPLRLAWAITIHKSQGMSLDAAEIDLSRSFIPGMGYVALSRVRSLSGLKLMGMNNLALMVNGQVAEMDKEFIDQSHQGVLYLKGLKKEEIETLQKDFLNSMKPFKES